MFLTAQTHTHTHPYPLGPPPLPHLHNPPSPTDTRCRGDALPWSPGVTHRHAWSRAGTRTAAHGREAHRPHWQRPLGRQTIPRKGSVPAHRLSGTLFVPLGKREAAALVGGLRRVTRGGGGGGLSKAVSNSAAGVQTTADGTKAWVCLKGRALWGQTQSGYKTVGARCKIGWGGSHWRLETRVGGLLGLRTCLRVELKEERSGGTPPPFKQSPVRRGCGGGGWTGMTGSGPRCNGGCW